MPDNTNFGAKFSIDVTSLKAGLAEANRLIRESESNFRQTASALDDWTQCEEGLTARQQTLNNQIDVQKQKVDALTQQKQNLIDKMTAEGKSSEEISKAIDAVNKQIVNESKQLDKLKSDYDKNNQALDKFKEGNEKSASALGKLKKYNCRAGKEHGRA